MSDRVILARGVRFNTPYELYSPNTGEFFNVHYRAIFNERVINRKNCARCKICEYQFLDFVLLLKDIEESGVNEDAECECTPILKMCCSREGMRLTYPFREVTVDSHHANCEWLDAYRRSSTKT